MILKNRYVWMVVALIAALMIRFYYEHHRVTNMPFTDVITVTSQPTATHLFYAGTIQSLKSIVVTSPAEGVINDMTFHYGDEVKKDQLLFVILSLKFQTDYKAALLQYVKAKTDFNNAHSQLVANTFLHNNQLISDDAMKEKKSAFFTAQLNLMQAKDTLVAMLKQLDIKRFDFESLTIEDIDKINDLLHGQGDSQYIHIASPAAGVVLLPTDSTSLSVKFNKGSAVKQGDVLAMIGDVSGLTIRISVNEFNVNQLRLGQHVKVTGIAFPNMELIGHIVGIDHQGQSSGGGGMPMFPVEIVVPQLTKEQAAVIHIGMSATVAIDMDNTSEMLVPIEAVHENAGSTTLNVQTNDKKIVTTPVNTGQTTPTAVVIQSGVKPGDHVVISH